MKKRYACRLCNLGYEFDEHMVVLASVHLELAGFPRRRFRKRDLHNKYLELHSLAFPADVHENLELSLSKISALKYMSV